MRALLSLTDRLAGRVAIGATSLGQCALVALGVHLAGAGLIERLRVLDLPWPAAAPAWIVLAVELLAMAMLWCCWPAPGRSRWPWRTSCPPRPGPDRPRP